MTNVKKGCRLVSICILLNVLLHWSNIWFPFKIIYHLQSYNRFAVIMAVMSLLFVLINGMAAIGLWRMQWWGFVTAYTAILFSTIFFAASYIPFFPKFFPEHYASLALFCANGAVLLAVIYFQVKLKVVPALRPKQTSRRKKAAK
jgi:uncharacterized membrane protein (DUF2068 family)